MRETGSIRSGPCSIGSSGAASPGGGEVRRSTASIRATSSAGENGLTT